MATNLLTDIGEEYVVKNGLDTATGTVGLYHDAGETTPLSDTSDVGAITTEPTNTNYARASVDLSAADLAGNWGADNDLSFTFDFSDQTTSQNVDAAFVVINFESTEAGDAAGAPADHLVANPALSQIRDIGSVDSIDFAAGDLSISLD